MSIINKINYYFCLMSAVLLALTSCSDKDLATGGDSNPENDNKPEYTVVMFIQPSGRDSYTADDLAELIALREEGKIDSSVNVVGIINPRVRADGESGSVFFDLGKKTGLSDSEIQRLHDIDCFAGCNEDSVFNNMVFSNMYHRHFADSSVSINVADTISSLIRQAVALHPAKHYAFILYGHGYGYSPVVDATNDSAYATRACLPDTYNSDQLLSLDEFIAGVRRSGVKFQTLMTHCCLMATLENITSYATQFDYYLGSQEQIYGTFCSRLIKNLSEAKGDEAKLQSGFQDVVDYYVDYIEEHRKTYPVKLNDPTSYGCYDLRKMPQLNAVVKRAADWFIDASKKDSDIVRDAIINSYYSVDKNIEPLLSNASRQHYKAMILHPDQTPMDEDTLKTAAMKVIGTNGTNIEDEFVFATLLKAALDSSSSARNSAQLDFNALQSIYDDYESTLKDMAYIRCDKGSLATSQDPYLYTSPSVHLVNFNKDSYMPTFKNSDFQYTMNYIKDLIQYYKAGDMETYKSQLALLYKGNWYAERYQAAVKNNDETKKSLYDVNNIAATYCSTPFHQATGWGTFLMQTTSNPVLLWNPVRHITK